MGRRLAVRMVRSSDGGIVATLSGRTMTVVLGGGRGTRLHPLTAMRAKPAVPLGAKYRLIDIPISNAINSGLREIFVLTQFNSASLNTHLARTYRFDPFTNGFVEILAAEQTDASGDWFQGTADAVRKHLHRLNREGVENVLILSGDHLYRMDYRQLLATHDEMGADITVSTIPVRREECDGFGVLAADSAGWIRAFREKPAATEDLSHLAIPAEMAERWKTGDRTHLASMGVYVFSIDVLQDLLSSGEPTDFGRDILPAAVRAGRPVAAHVFDGYWEDIGTIAAFFEANMMLCETEPRFRFYDPSAPIYTRPRFMPPTMVRNCQVERSLFAEGCLLDGARLDRVVVGLRSVVHPGAEISEAILMGADFYEVDDRRAAMAARGLPPLGIGAGASIRRAIIDKNARIGAGAVIHGGDRPDEEHENYVVRDGIVIVNKGAVIPPGARL